MTDPFEQLGRPQDQWSESDLQRVQRMLAGGDPPGPPPPDDADSKPDNTNVW